MGADGMPLIRTLAGVGRRWAWGLRVHEAPGGTKYSAASITLFHQVNRGPFQNCGPAETLYRKLFKIQQRDLITEQLPVTHHECRCQRAFSGTRRPRKKDRFIGAPRNYRGR